LFTRLINLNNKTIKTVIIYIILGIIAVLMLFPLVWLVSTAFKSPSENIFQFPPQFIPSQPTFQNFIKVWQTNPFGRYLFNSSFVALLTVSLNLLFCSLAAYPLARLNFKGRDGIFTAIIATIMIPFQIVMIPNEVLDFPHFPQVVTTFTTGCCDYLSNCNDS
jgi:putative chitobiose transport system permease protein